MRRVSGGYTILEVAIVLAISLGIMAAAWNLISGKQAETDFNQKMRDTQSKLQDWINDIATGNTGGDPTSQGCKAVGGRPQVNSGGPSSSPDCIFLGKAIQFTDQNYSTTQDEELYAYSVFGCRLKACLQNNAEPISLYEANPKAADGPKPLPDLTETFSLAPAHVKSVTSYLVGFFNSLDTKDRASSNGAEDVNVYQFAFNGHDVKNGTIVDQCLQLLNSCATASNPPPLTTFTACLTDGTRYAEINISSQNGIGAQTDLVYQSC